jgi:two-component system OmpR family sensor kinase
VALLLAGYLAKPIRTLRGSFEAVASGDLDRRIAPRIGTRHDELADLGRNFRSNGCAVEGLDARPTSPAADVSHELRSPLARLQAAAGLMH